MWGSNSTKPSPTAARSGAGGGGSTSTELSHGRHGNSKVALNDNVYKGFGHCDFRYSKYKITIMVIKDLDKVIPGTRKSP